MTDAERSAYFRDKAHETHAQRLGLTPEEIAELESDDCAVCGRQATEDEPNKVYQDASGTVRGTACKLCARALGHLHHDPERLRNALKLLA